MPHSVKSLTEELDRNDTHTLTGAYHASLLRRIAEKERSLGTAMIKLDQARDVVDTINHELDDMREIRATLERSPMIDTPVRQDDDGEKPDG